MVKGGKVEGDDEIHEKRLPNVSVGTMSTKGTMKDEGESNKSAAMPKRDGVCSVLLPPPTEHRSQDDAVED